MGCCHIQGLITGTAMCVAYSSLIHSRLYSPTGVSVHPVCTVRSARIFVLGFLKVLFPELPLPSTTFHVTYPLGLD